MRFGSGAVHLRGGAGRRRPHRGLDAGDRVEGLERLGEERPRADLAGPVAVDRVIAGRPNVLPCQGGYANERAIAPGVARSGNNRPRCAVPVFHQVPAGIVVVDMESHRPHVVSSARRDAVQPRIVD